MQLATTYEETVLFTLFDCGGFDNIIKYMYLASKSMHIITPDRQNNIYNIKLYWLQGVDNTIMNDKSIMKNI